MAGLISLAQNPPYGNIIVAQVRSSITKLDFSHFDRHFASFINKIDITKSDYILVAAALVTNALQNGHTCIVISDYADIAVPENNLPIPFEQFPTIETWYRHFASSDVVGKNGMRCPLILEDGRLYLYRYWNYENQLASIILSKSSAKFTIGIADHCDTISELCKFSQDTIDWQTIAVIASIINDLTIISGGPGTGKTTTVARILAALLLVHGVTFRIALAAPTGKAAARLSSSLIAIIPSLHCSEEIRDAIPRQAQTLHRLLGSRPDSIEFLYNAENPLPFNAVVVDEASMVDLSLMAKLAMALPKNCKLILLGDKDQLSSVEAGSVLGDICDTGISHEFTEDFTRLIKIKIPAFPLPSSKHPSISNCLVNLQVSYRFTTHSSIGNLSRAVNKGDYRSAISILEQKDPSCQFKLLPPEMKISDALGKTSTMFFAPLISSDKPQTAFATLDRFKILCATRTGPYGVDSINQNISTQFFKSGYQIAEPVFHGKPIIITQNNYNLGLYNGDTGIIFRDSSNPSIFKVYFKGEGDLTRWFLLRQIPSFDTAYALTVHKSQGSEFDSVLLILPPIANPLLTRELLYTAITRAKNSIEIWGTPEILQMCIESGIKRFSGLRNKIWNN
jgi:exodeoxyribonuclease V alpha subunit